MMLTQMIEKTMFALMMMVILVMTVHPEAMM